MPRKTFTQRLKGETVNSSQTLPKPQPEIAPKIAPKSIPTLKPKSQELRIHELEKQVASMEHKIESLLDVLNQYPFLTAKFKGNKLPL